MNVQAGTRLNSGKEDNILVYIKTVPDMLNQGGLHAVSCAIQAATLLVKTKVPGRLRMTYLVVATAVAHSVSVLALNDWPPLCWYIGKGQALVNASIHGANDIRRIRARPSTLQYMG